MAPAGRRPTRDGPSACTSGSPSPRIHPAVAADDELPGVVTPRAKGPLVAAERGALSDGGGAFRRVSHAALPRRSWCARRTAGPRCEARVGVQGPPRSAGAVGSFVGRNCG